MSDDVQVAIVTVKAQLVSTRPYGRSSNLQCQLDLRIIFGVGILHGSARPNDELESYETAALRTRGLFSKTKCWVHKSEIIGPEAALSNISQVTSLLSAAWAAGDVSYLWLHILLARRRQLAVTSSGGNSERVRPLDSRIL